MQILTALLTIITSNIHRKGGADHIVYDIHRPTELSFKINERFQFKWFCVKIGIQMAV